MSDPGDWQKGNDDYLAAALTWLRLRLASKAIAAHAPVVKDVPILARRSWFQREAPSPPPEPAPPPRVSDAMVAEAAAKMAAAEAIDPPPALVLLSRRLGLSRFEQQTLLLCAAVEFDTRVGALCAGAQDDQDRRNPTFALALALLEEPAWDALSPERPLRFWRLLEINQPGAQPLTTSALRADERIVNYIKGLNYLDDRLAPMLAPLGMTDAGELPPSQQSCVDAIVRRLRQAPRDQRPPLMQLVGPDSESKRLIAARAAAEFGLQLYRLPAEALPAQAAELETLARLWRRDSLLSPIALYVDAREAAGPTAADGPAPPLQRFLSRIEGMAFLDSREMQSGPDSGGVNPASHVLDIAKPTPAEQKATWAQALGAQANDSPAMLAGQFDLNLMAIGRIARTAIAENPESSASDAALHDRLWDECLAMTRPRLDALAKRLDAKATWDDIVLPAEALDLLRQLAAQVASRSRVYEDWGFHAKMNRGLGISALFAGESGTGKTMAAEVVANALRLDLYRIDLSAVVSKYIGETEKNLRRVFDRAEDGGAILFFDEADALFGKRSEVKDSHDRYANIEINYLLQRMEGFRGLAILATNMKGALDTAFVRRLRFIVNFAFPGQSERTAIWRKVFPPRTPTLGLDYERLARLNITGGAIHNIALNAAFLAARGSTPVTMPLVLEAARGDFRKDGKAINEADFRMLEAVGAKA